jgi:hypothetical protein
LTIPHRYLLQEEEFRAPYNELKANAKLISKAPEAYEALIDEKLFLAEILMTCEDEKVCNDISLRMSRIKSLLKEIES